MISTTSYKILCVDDEKNILHMFRRTLGRQYQILTADSADNALTLLRDHGDFAVILSDYNMPDINGVEFLAQARTISPDSVQIMLTGNIELDVAIKTINETNIFRYLPKPCAIKVLAKVIDDALEQYRLIQDKRRLTAELEQKNLELAASNTELSKQKYMLEYELEMAKIVYSKLALYGEEQPDGLDYILAAKETVGGDILLTHASDDGRSTYLMMGDLTGHGLQSALAVLLVTEIFDALCATGLSIEKLAESINDKMCRKLPTGLFCAAVLIKLDWPAQRMHIWQGGMPEVYLLDTHGQILKTLPSVNLPLGVLAGQDFTATASSHDLASASSVFVYSDGVTEQTNTQQQMFGSERLKDTLSNTPVNQRRVDHVIEELRIHQQQQPQCDDISLFELHLLRIKQPLAHI